MIASIDKSIEEREKNERLVLTPDSEEFMKHAVLVQEKCEGVRGRDAIIQVCCVCFLVWDLESYSKIVQSYEDTQVCCKRIRYGLDWARSKGGGT